MTTERDELLKNNAINMAKFHREKCDDEYCGVSLFLLRELIEKAGIELTDSECSEFI